MTLIVGVKCSDGIVLGADSTATLGIPLGGSTIRQDTVTKLHIASGKLVIGVSGPVSLSQSYSDEIDAYISLKGLKITWKNVAEAKAELVKLLWKHAKPAWERAGVVSQTVGAQAAVIECNHASAAAFAIGDSPHLIQFSPHCNPEEVTQDLPFVAIGSGQGLADPFLAFIRRIFWSAGLPSLFDGQIATVWTLDEVIKHNPGGVGGDVKLVVVKKNDKGNWVCEEVPSAEIDGHRQFITDIERRMREAPVSTPAETIPSVTEPPEPAS